MYKKAVFEKKACEICGKLYTPKRKIQRYCSLKCKNYSYGTSAEYRRWYGILYRKVQPDEPFPQKFVENIEKQL